MTTVASETPPPRRRSRWRTALRVLGAMLLVLVLVVAVMVFRGLRVQWSHDDYARYWEQRATEPGDVLYVALGDSLAQGIGASEPAKGYVGLLADDLGRQTGGTVRVVNLSVTGARAADVVTDQLPQLEELLTEGSQPALVTLDVGANDVGRTAPDVFAGQLATILDALPDGALVADVPDFGGGSSQVEGRALSDVVHAAVTERPALEQVELQAATEHLGLRDWSPDWFHPSDRGYTRYHEAFREAADRV